MSTPLFSKTASVCIQSGHSLMNQKGIPEPIVSVNWGVDHPNNYEESALGYSSGSHAELHAARRVIRNALQQNYTRIIIRTHTHFVWHWIRNAANFARAPAEVAAVVQSIYALKSQIIVNLELVNVDV